jgi:hypothetical protein
MAQIRVKTTWFKKGEGPRDFDETASVVAATIWKMADRAVINLSQADYDIITPARGFTIMGELMAFMVHLSDRMLHERVADDERSALIQAMGKRLAEIVERNIHDVVGDDGFDYQANFIDMLNRRAQDYAAFDFSADKPDFPVLRYLGNRICDIMGERDQPWIIDQIMELETPQILETLQKTINGLFNPT